MQEMAQDFLPALATGCWVPVPHANQEPLKVAAVYKAIRPVVNSSKSLFQGEIVGVDELVFQIFKFQMQIDFVKDYFAKSSFN